MVLSQVTPSLAQTHFRSYLDSSQIPNFDTDASGELSLTLNPEQDQLRYSLTLNGVQLKANPATRTAPEDVVGIHIHLFVPDTTGPHILNVFGTPSEDDADLLVNYADNSLTGIFDNGDASRDPETGELLPQFFPLTTKLMSNWLDELQEGELFIAVHTVGAEGAMALSGTILPVPEPTTGWLLFVCLFTHFRIPYAARC